jgi:hypothetical protein
MDITNSSSTNDEKLIPYKIPNYLHKKETNNYRKKKNYMSKDKKNFIPKDKKNFENKNNLNKNFQNCHKHEHIEHNMNSKVDQTAKKNSTTHSVWSKPPNTILSAKTNCKKYDQDLSDGTHLNDLNINDGQNIILPHLLTLWSHDIYDKNWNIDSYKQLCKIRTVSDFWRLSNNYKKIGWKYMHSFLMKDDIEPIWEHKANRYGGVCSFKIELECALEIWEDLNARFICGLLTENSEDINGISISPKNNWAIIKIWNRDKKNDLSVTLNPQIIEKYKELSIKYKLNEPEY